MSALIADLLDHLRWADERLRAVLAEDDRSAADAEILRTLAHVVAVEQLWLARVRGEPMRVAVWPLLVFEECVALFAETHAGLRALQATLTPEVLAREVAYVNSAGESWRNTVEEILTQLSLHGQYHRGQIVRAIRRAGGTPVPTDFIVWARTAKGAGAR